MRSGHAERVSTSLASTQINAGTVVWLNVRQHRRDTFRARIKKMALVVAACIEQLMFVIKGLITACPPHPKDRNAANCADILPFSSPVKQKLRKSRN